VVTLPQQCSKPNTADETFLQFCIKPTTADEPLPQHCGKPTTADRTLPQHCGKVTTVVVALPHFCTTYPQRRTVYLQRAQGTSSAKKTAKKRVNTPLVRCAC
jgi:hypothetical protein